MNFSFLTTPKILALNSGNFSVKFFNAVLTIGQFFCTAISKTFILSPAKGTLSKAPGASNFLNKDLATSASGEIITSIGKFDLLYSLLHLPSKNSFDLILAIFFPILNKLCAS